MPNSQLLVRYTAEGSSLKNDMIVYPSAAAGRERQMGGYHGEMVGLFAALGLNLALSKGEIRLRSNDYRDQPWLDYNLLDHEEDLRRCRDGIRLVVGLEDHPSMAAMIDKRVYPEDSDLESDEALDLWMKRSVGTGHHISCTARMGPSSDPMAVVDQYGRVYGAEGPAGGGRLDHARVRPGQHQRHRPDDRRARRRLHQAGVLNLECEHGRGTSPASQYALHIRGKALLLDTPPIAMTPVALKPPMATTPTVLNTADGDYAQWR